MNKVLDSYSTLSSREVDDNGFWKIERNPLAREGVMTYMFSQLPVEVPQGKTKATLVQVLKSPKGFPQAYLDSLKGKPIILNHTWLSDVGEELNDAIVAGNIGDNVVFEDGVLYANIYINSSKAQQIIESGFEELSIGSTTRVVQESGEYLGEHYDYVMFHEVANHVAIVAEGRCGHNVKVLDNALKEQDMQGKEEVLVEVSVGKSTGTLTDIEAKLEGFEGKEDIIALIKQIIEGTEHVTDEEEEEEEVVKEEKEEKIEDALFTPEQMGAIEDIVKKMLSDVTDSEEFSNSIIDSVSSYSALKEKVETKYGVLPSKVFTKSQILEYVGKKEGIVPTMDSVSSFLKASRSFNHVIAPTVQNASSDEYRNRILGRK